MKHKSSGRFWSETHHPRLTIVLGILLGMVLGAVIAYFAP
jgi:hypothetical protein